MSLETEIKQLIREQIEAGNGGNIWNSMMKQIKSAVVQQAMETTINNQSEASRQLGINRASFRTYARESLTDAQLREVGML